MKTLALFLFVVAISTVANSQEIYQTIRGKVTDKDSKQPLVGATVVLLDTDPIIGVTTDIEGDYVLKNVPIGRQNLNVSYIGYHSTEAKNILLQSGKEVIINLELSEKIESLGVVEVKAYSQNGQAMNEMAPVSARSFSIEQTERFAGSLGDPARMVGNYAGVVMQNDSRNDIIIRGNSPIGVIWRLDDIEIPNPNHFGALGTTGGPVSMLNNNLLTNSDFFTGAFPAQFGNGISGAFDLNMRSGNNQKTEFTGQIGFNGFEFGVEGPFSKKSKASYLINARYSTMALMHKIGFGSGTGSAVPYYQDVTFKIDLPTSRIGKFSAFGILGNSSIDLGAEIGDTAATSYNLTDQHTKFSAGQQVVGLSHLFFFNEKTRIKTTISGQVANDKTDVDTYNFSDNSIQQYYRGDNTQSKLTFASHLKSKINNKNNFSMGLYLNYNKIAFLDSVYLQAYDRYITQHDTDDDFLTYRAYAQYQYKFTDNFSLFAGVNSLANSINKDYAIEPRAGLEWKFNSKQSLTFGYGKHSQMQPASIYFLQYNDTINNSVIFTNTNTGLTKADHLVLGYSHQLFDNMRVKVETYYQNIYNVPVSPTIHELSLLNAGEFFNIATTDSLVNIGKGKNYGVEITLEKFLQNGYYVLFTTSLFDSKYTGYDGVWRNTAFNSNYIFNLLAGYEFKIKSKIFLTFDLKSVYSGGKRYIPVNLQESIANDEITFDYDDAYTKKFDDYFRMDFRIGIKLNGKKFSQEWAIDLQNLTNHQAPFMQGYDNNKEEIYESYQQGFYPMFLYRIQF